MALFKNNKKLCPICGSPTPRVLPMRIDGQAICSECDKKASVQPEILENMTIPEYAEHLAYREKNKGVLSSFTDTKVVEMTKADKLHIDEKQQLLYIESAKLGKNPPCSALMSFPRSCITNIWELIAFLICISAIGVR